MQGPRSTSSGSGRSNGSRRKDGNGDLTVRQEEVLLHCVRKGYYEIPRRMTLRSLAGELGISVTSLSLILRRAEAKLVQSFARKQPAEVAPVPLLGPNRFK